MPIFTKEQKQATHMIQKGQKVIGRSEPNQASNADLLKLLNQLNSKQMPRKTTMYAYDILAANTLSINAGDWFFIGIMLWWTRIPQPINEEVHKAFASSQVGPSNQIWSPGTYLLPWCLGEACGPLRHSHQNVNNDQVKGTVPRDFLPLVFFFKLFLLGPVDMPRNYFDFFLLFAEIFDYFGASPSVNDTGIACIAGFIDTSE
jgi:hypothetical protein